MDTLARLTPRKLSLSRTHDKGIQTDYPNSMHLPSRSGSTGPASAASAFDMRSEESSVLEAGLSPVAALLTCVDGLVVRMTQADALTLTNRLKRQHIRGADVSHISRTTINTVLSEVRSLRQRYNNLLECERTSWTQKELVFLFRLLKTVFEELGKIRMVFNDIILHPTIARSVSERALNPPLNNDKTVVSGRSTPGFVGWMAPITRFLVGPSHDILSSSQRPALSDYGNETDSRALANPVPKLPPALAATTATVNAEFYQRGTGQVVTNRIVGRDDVFEAFNAMANVSSSSRSTVMDIFAGAPRKRGPNSWVFVPKRPSERRGTSRTVQRDILSERRTKENNSISRDVDAIIDHFTDHDGTIESPREPLLQRTLRRRGLSDSSIRSTFLNDTDKESQLAASSRRQGIYPTQRDNGGFGLTGHSATLQQVSSDGRNPELRPRPSGSRNHANAKSELSHSLYKTNPQGINILPNLASWAASGAGLRGDLAEEFVGSFVDSGSGSAHHSQWPRDMLGRDI